MIAVAFKDTDEMIGEIVVMPGDGVISLGYTISYKYHRKGYAFEALSALINLLHEQYPKWKFISLTEPENVPSMALLKKLGYKDAGYDTGTESQIFEKWTGSAATKDQRGFHRIYSSWRRWIKLTTKESILALFEEQRGVYFSGEEIAARLAVSRAAVWKAVNSLRTEGYEMMLFQIRDTALQPIRICYPSV